MATSVLGYSHPNAKVSLQRPCTPVLVCLFAASAIHTLGPSKTALTQVWPANDKKSPGPAKSGKLKRMDFKGELNHPTV